MMSHSSSSDSDSDSSNNSENSTDTDSSGDSNHEYSGKALQLISYKRSSDFEEDLQLNLDTAILRTVLQSCKGKPICPISVTGVTRSGSSFLINGIKDRIHGFEDNAHSWNPKKNAFSGFKWGSGYESVTKGIWIWSKAFIVEADGKDVAVLLLDTQGFNEEISASTADETFVTLGISLLLSSITILNVNSSIPEGILKCLTVFVKYGTVYKKKVRDAQPFNQISFIVRDWTRLTEYGFGGDPGKKFLYQTFNMQAAELEKKFKKCCDELTCFLLPNIGTKALVKTYSGQTTDLNPEFLKYLKILVTNLTKEDAIIPKKILGHEIAAEEFEAFLVALIDLFNSKSEMELGLKPESLWNAIVSAAGRLKLNRGLDAYKKVYATKNPTRGGYLKDSTIDGINVKATAAATEAFKLFNLPEGEESRYLNQLTQLLKKETEQLKDKNEGAKRKKIADNLANTGNEFQGHLSSMYPFNPEPGVNIPENCIFYDQGTFDQNVTKVQEELKRTFLEHFNEEDDEGFQQLCDSIDNVLEPIGNAFSEKNRSNQREADTAAKRAVANLKNEYINSMNGLLSALPDTISAEILAVLHVKEITGIIQKFQTIRLGTKDYESMWIQVLSEEIELERQTFELGLKAVMTEALQMSNKKVEQHKSDLEKKAEELENEQELKDYHEERVTEIIETFTRENPFPQDHASGEVVLRLLKNSLDSTLTKVLEEKIYLRKELEVRLQLAQEKALKYYGSEILKHMDEKGFLDEQEFERESNGCMDMTLAMFLSEADNISVSDEEKTNATDNLNYELKLIEGKLRKESDERHTAADLQASSISTTILEKYNAKMMEAVRVLSTKEELTMEHEKLKTDAMNDFQKQCTSKNSSIRQKYLKKMEHTAQESFAGVNDFFTTKIQAENVVISEACLTVKEDYVNNMNKHFANKNGFFSAEDLKSIHETTLTAAMKKLPADLVLTTQQKKEINKKIEFFFEGYKNRNDLVLSSYENAEPAVGIDLGTTYCCVAVYTKGKVTIIRNSASGSIIPSYVRISQDGTTEFGTPAKDNAYMSPETTIFDAKRIIGRRIDDEKLQDDMKFWPFTVVEEGGCPKVEVHGKKYCPEEISGLLLKHLKEEAEATMSFPIKKAVITVPAYFTDGQRQATISAGELAGLEVLAILNEPTAAALAYRLDCCDDDKKRNILVFDLGGGTFDVAILQVDKENINVLGIGGDPHLGGEDFDKNMMKYCAERFLETTEIDLFENKDSEEKTLRDDCRRNLRRLQTKCEEGKKALTTAPATKISIAAFVGTEDLIVEVKKRKFEELNNDLFTKTIKIVDDTLMSANLTKNQIDEIVLVGGSTRIPKLQKMLTDHFDGKVLNKQIDPDQAVAYGAAVQAAIKCAKPDVKLFDFEMIQEITPMALGIETADKYLDIIIPKGTKIPTTAHQEYQTYRDNQPSAMIRIFQGEKHEAAKNKLLGDFTLEGIPPNKARKEVVFVKMHINSNGILSVEATCKSTGSKTMTVCEERGIMNQKEVRRLVGEAKKKSKGK